VLPFTVITSALFLRARPSLRVLVACGTVTAGFFVGVFLDNQKTGPSALGISFGLLSSVTTAVNAVIIKRSLDFVDGSALTLAWYTNVLSALLLAPCMLIVGEAPGIYSLLFGTASGSEDVLRTFLWGTAVTGLFGFLICIAGFLSIKITSPITHMVSSAVRGVLATLLGVWLFGDVVTT
jgi:solute carrier family 35 (GDP-fucose transporter), member C1